jgi:hypothetical protein
MTLFGQVPRPQLHQDLIAAMKTVQNTSAESAQHQDAVDRRAAIDYLLRLKEIHAEEWTQTVFVIGAYIADLYRQGSVDEDTCAAFMRPILNKLTDLSGLFKALSGALSDEYRWTVFHGMQDTKRVQWIDTPAKYYRRTSGATLPIRVIWPSRPRSSPSHVQGHGRGPP